MESFKMSAQTLNDGDPYGNRFTGNFIMRDTEVKEEIHPKGKGKSIRSNSMTRGGGEEGVSCFLKIFGCGRQNIIERKDRPKKK